jgi:hypothetical protein
MSIILPHISLTTILLGFLVLGYFALRLLGFRIGPKRGIRWFWGELNDKNQK